LPCASTESNGQVRQGADHEPSLYVPFEHFVHRIPFAPVYPGSQRHDVLLVLPRAELELAGQEVQAPDPISDLY